MFEAQGYTTLIILAIVGIGFLAIVIRMYKKALQGQALVKTGFGGTTVNFSGMLIVPVIHKLEIMDITLKTIVISRTGNDGLVCQDNMRADIKVTFFVRVNQTKEDVKQVAQSIGCARASDQSALEGLFEAMFFHGFFHGVDFTIELINFFVFAFYFVLPAFDFSINARL